MHYNIPYGVHFIGEPHLGNVQVGIWAPEAEKVEFCLFNKAGDAWIQSRIEFLEYVGYGNWQGNFNDVYEGQHYGFRVHGKWEPENGLFFNPAKLLLDPYAKAVSKNYNYNETVFSFETVRDANNRIVPRFADDKLLLNPQDSAPNVPHGIITSSPQVEHNHPNTPWSTTVIYEAHVVGLTKNAPWLSEDLRGTYAGLGHPDTIKYLIDLGITAIELLPIHAKISEAHLIDSGLENYWGYSTLNFFAPEPSYATTSAQNQGAQAIQNEVKEMVKSLHNADIEVLLDVVYNHSCEESRFGPTLCYRGIANRNYYRHMPDDFSTLDDSTGCGNSFNFSDDHIIKLAHDSLRHWVTEYGIDGFRFDLMVTCARLATGFTPEHPFLVGIKNDAVLANRKMIAEPWDLGIGGWRTGGFGFPFSEWNDSFRNNIRGFWVTDLGRTKINYSISPPQNFATKLAGSSDIFMPGAANQSRGPLASVNYITAHDGFTLYDLVSYNEKHNEANGENNQDGSNDNNSYNHGAEGITKNREINDAREQTLRNLLGTLILSTGIPMITAGDEFGRSQLGNNNAYCQNSPISWANWTLKPWQKNLIDTTAHLISIKKSFPALHQKNFFQGLRDNIDCNLYDKFVRETDDKRSEIALDIFDLCWFHSDGSLFSPEEWQNTHFRTFQAFFAAPGTDVPNSNRDVLIVINGSNTDEKITLPKARKWEYLWNSTQQLPKRSEIVGGFISPAFSMQIFASI